ncbi:gamma-aminobutyric acid type B receptor subunit 2-like [Ptychodera flava]|uniref:gamma-aminobutyric acid type B receptor subunit 2-like n=1 Tax=Ptychodera flava TaxID=63121 RepID=UPI00396A787A
MVILDFVISACWIIFDPMTSIISVLEKKESTDENGHDFLYIYQTRNCYSAYTLYWTISLFVIKGILLFLGVFLAWAIRSIQVAALNESRQIAMSVYAVALVCVIVFVGQYFLGSKVTMVYVITGLGIFFSNTLVLCLAFLPKMILLYQNPHDVNTSIVKPGQRNIVKSRPGGYHLDQKDTTDSLRETLKMKIQKLALLRMSYEQLCSELLPNKVDNKSE